MPRLVDEMTWTGGQPINARRERSKDRLNMLKEKVAAVYFVMDNRNDDGTVPWLVHYASESGSSVNVQWQNFAKFFYRITALGQYVWDVAADSLCHLEDGEEIFVWVSYNDYEPDDGYWRVREDMFLPVTA
jgi:hypothetical protein